MAIRKRTNNNLQALHGKIKIKLHERHETPREHSDASVGPVVNATQH